MIACQICGHAATIRRAERSQYENWSCECRRLVVVRNVTKFITRTPRVAVSVTSKNLAGRNDNERRVITIEISPKMAEYDATRVSRKIAQPEHVLELLRDPDAYAACADVLTS